MSHPPIHISEVHDLVDISPEVDKALIAFTSKPIDVNSWKQEGLTLNVCCSDLNPSEYTTLYSENDDVAPPCTLDDIEQIFDVLEGVRDFSSLYIWDQYDSSLSFATALGCYCYYNEDPQDKLFTLVKTHQKIKPSSSWIISLFDYSLSLDGKLIQIYDEYMATGIVVNSKAVMTKATWAL